MVQEEQRDAVAAQLSTTELQKLRSSISFKIDRQYQLRRKEIMKRVQTHLRQSTLVLLIYSLKAPQSLWHARIVGLLLRHSGDAMKVGMPFAMHAVSLATILISI